jgi:hypothetical protein
MKLDIPQRRIIVQWRECSPEEIRNWGYKKEMRVVQSNHPRFSAGTRFDFGFFDIASNEGYAILSLP